MAVHKALFSSKSDEWETPEDLFQSFNIKYKFDLDVCATNKNAKVKRFFTKDTDGLSIDWHKYSKNAWMNPPYGNTIGKWIQKAYEESLKGTTVVCLLPARTDTKWFHTYCTKGNITFLRGRLKFVGAASSAPFPSMIVVFKGEPNANSNGSDGNTRQERTDVIS